MKSRHPCSWFLECVESAGSYDVGQTIPSHCVSIPKILITPTRVFTVGFETETSNRAIQLFHNVHGISLESFARVQVLDEDMSSIFPRDIASSIETRFRQLLNRGIDVAGKHFTFLAYSSSQLKEASVWMVSLPDNNTVVQLRSELGTITEKTASKYAARLGQCFSTTFCESHMSPEISTAVVRYQRNRRCAFGRDGADLASRDESRFGFCSLCSERTFGCWYHPDKIPRSKRDVRCLGQTQ